MRTPKLCLHSRGVYYVRFRGKYIYFKKDKSISERMYLDWLRDVWGPAQTERQIAKTSPTILDVVEMYLSWVHQNRSKKLFMDYRSYLRPLVAMVPTMPLSQLDTQVCEALKQDMLGAGYKPATVNHSLKAVRRMVGWADMQGVVDSTPRISAVSAPIPRRTVQSKTPTEVQTILLQTAGDILTWLTLTYLTCARPSEIVRLAHGDGEWIERNVFRTQSKVGNRTGYDRFLLFSDEALTWVPHLEPRWSTHNTYGKAVVKLGMGGPRQLRTAGASHLRAAGVSYKDIRVILGHTEAGAVVHYVEEDFSTVLPFLNRLSVLPLTPC